MLFSHRQPFWKRMDLLGVVVAIGGVLTGYGSQDLEMLEKSVLLGVRPGDSVSEHIEVGRARKAAIDNPDPLWSL